MQAPSASQPVKTQSKRELSLIQVLGSLNSSITDMSYAIGRLHFTLDAGHEEFERYVCGEESSLSSVTDSNPPIEGSPVVVPRSVTDPLVHIDTVTQYTVGDQPGALTDNNAAALAQSKPKWYAITVGREPGVFLGSQTVMANTSCIPGAGIFPCGSEAEAQGMFDRELDAGRVEQVEFVHKRTVITRNIVPVGTYIVPK